MVPTINFKEGLSFAGFVVIEIEFLAEWWSSSTCTIYTDDHTWEKLGSEHAVLLLNHSYEVDWLFSWFFCEHVRMLGSAKALVKKSFKKVPIIGWTAFFFRKCISGEELGKRQDNIREPNI